MERWDARHFKSPRTLRNFEVPRVEPGTDGALLLTGEIIIIWHMEISPGRVRSHPNSVNFTGRVGSLISLNSVFASPASRLPTALNNQNQFVEPQQIDFGFPERGLPSLQPSPHHLKQSPGH